ncbi:MAG: diguanylate cyclase [Negativicutes bacterium]|nr:diguanylate cyclase [Negativicutes bacterium]
MEIIKNQFRLFTAKSEDGYCFQRILLDENNLPYDYQIISVNEALLKIFQKNKDHFIGRRITDQLLFSAEFSNQLAKLYSNVSISKNTESKEIYYKELKKMILVTVFYMGKNSCVTRFSNVSEEKIVEKSFTEIFNYNPEFLVITDEKFKIVKVNKTFEQIAGNNLEVILYNGFLKFIHIEDIAETLNSLTKVNNVNPMVTFCNKLRKNNNTYIEVEWWCMLNKGYIYLSGRDVTAEKVMKRKIEQANKELLMLHEQLKEENEKLLKSAIKDELTGVYNRKFFEKRVVEEMEIADRANEHISLIIFDLDRFKLVNDNFGHQFGDEVLKRTTQIAGDLIRKTDFLNRVGGEEFAIILPNTNKAQAVFVAEKVRKALEDNKHFKVGQVTGSFGVAERMKAESLRSWYKRADNALYQAKNTGRNRVVDSDKIDIPLVSLQVQWRQEWNCGNDEIDEQHDKILQIANDLITKIYAGASHNECMDMIKLFLEYAVNHFATEERILMEIEYDGLIAHIKKHEYLTNKAIYLKECYEKKELQPAAFLSFIIDEVVVEHLTKEDTKFFALLKQS